jgi:hypothetical protein
MERAPHAACRDCRQFENSAHALEQALPGLKVMSSGAASVRDGDGLCRVHQRLVSEHSFCERFVPS